MLHIIILNKGYFPEKLKSSDSSKDKVVVIASATDSIPVSAYQNDALRNMEIKLLPDLKDTGSAEGRNILRISQAVIIGQLTAAETEYEIYSDDSELLKALTPFTGKKIPSKKQGKKAQRKAPVNKEEEVSEKKEQPKEDKKEEVASAPRKKPMVSSEVVKSVKTARKNGDSQKSSKEAKAETGKKAKKSGEIPTQAQVKRVIGASNSAYAKLIHDTMKKSNQITFEMNVRMELAKAGLDAGACQELAKTLNDEFGKVLPIS